MDRLEMLLDWKCFEQTRQVEHSDLENDTSSATGQRDEIGFPCNQRVGGFLLNSLQGNCWSKTAKTRDQFNLLLVSVHSGRSLIPGHFPSCPINQRSITIFQWPFVVITVARTFFPAVCSARGVNGTCTLTIWMATAKQRLVMSFHSAGRRHLFIEEMANYSW